MKLKVALKPNTPPKEFSIRRFEELFGLQYLSHLQFSDWRCEQWIRKKCAWAYKKGRIGDLNLWLGKLHAKEMISGAIPDVSIRWIHDKIGYGLFTNRPFKKWEFIGEYTGLLRGRSLLFPKVNDYCFMYPTEWKWAFKAFTIDAGKQGNYTRFINHSDTPNSESVSVYHDGFFHIIFRTIEDIPADTQLTYDYGDIFWREKVKPLDDIQNFS